jgi:hypothetical protein
LGMYANTLQYYLAGCDWLLWLLTSYLMFP